MRNRKIAIDIVFLLPNEIGKAVCDLSKKISLPKNQEPYVLDNIKYIPHASILMGIVEENKIGLIKEKLEPIIKKYLPLELDFTGVENIKWGEVIFPYLTIRNKRELKSLQEEIWQTVHLDYDSTRDAFFDANISDSGIDYVGNFKKNKIDKNDFDLHVTLGAGNRELVGVDFPPKAKINTVAICHLGYGCSCRKILSKITV